MDNNKHVPGAICIITGLLPDWPSYNDNGIVCELVKLSLNDLMIEKYDTVYVLDAPYWEIKNTSRKTEFEKTMGLNLYPQKFLKVIGGPQIDVTEEVTNKLLEPA